MRARIVACRAPRVGIHVPTYYEDISKDDSIFDLYDEMENIPAQDESKVDFELDYLDDINLGIEGDSTEPNAIIIYDDKTRDDVRIYSVAVRHDIAMENNEWAINVSMKNGESHHDAVVSYDDVGDDSDLNNDGIGEKGVVNDYGLEDEPVVTNNGQDIDSVVNDNEVSVIIPDKKRSKIIIVVGTRKRK